MNKTTEKFKVQWPQNNGLSGQTKMRLSYDSLSIYQWVLSFGRSIVIQYVHNLVGDTQDFSRVAAKASQSILLCNMEDCQD